MLEKIKNFFITAGNIIKYSFYTIIFLGLLGWFLDINGFIEETDDEKDTTSIVQSDKNNNPNETESSEISFSPKSLSDCNRTYYETEYETTWTSTKDASLKYNRWSGRITYSPPSTKKNTAKIAWGMNDSKFFEHCSSGNIGVWSTACSHFQQCVSVVKNLEMNNQDFVLLGYQGTAEFLKETLYSRGKTEERENCIGNNCWMTVDNITQACDVVQRTYSATTVGDSIFENIPELDYEQSQALGVKAVKGYGECLCALHDFLNIKDDYSIGYCIGDNYFDCERGEGAFCGRNIKR